MPTVTYRNQTDDLYSTARQATIENRIHYERHRPEETALYQLVQEHIESFFAQVEAETGSGLPDFVKDEFDAFLECGVLAHGFLRLRCADCTHVKSWSPFPVSGGDSVLRAAGGAWHRRLLT